MTVSPENYFAFADILLYDVVGDLWLFILIGLLIIIFLCAKYNLPFQLSLIMCLLYLMILMGIVFNMLIWVFVVLLVGTISYYLISKTFKRG